MKLLIELIELSGINFYPKLRKNRNLKLSFFNFFSLIKLFFLDFLLDKKIMLVLCCVVEIV